MGVASNVISVAMAVHSASRDSTSPFDWSLVLGVAGSNFCFFRPANASGPSEDSGRRSGPSEDSMMCLSGSFLCRFRKYEGIYINP